MSKQLKIWQNSFGKEYTDRCVVEWQKRKPAFEKMLEGLNLSKILEVGCNRGHNLLSISNILNDADITGVEPNTYAVSIARQSSDKISVLRASAFDLPFKNDYYDLVFTAGVLIHISGEDLSDALREIYRVSKEYILAIEYFSEEETEINYRGSDGLLWKRNFLKAYQQLFPDLELVKTGYWTLEDGFDRTTWWLLRKKSK